MVQEGMHHQLMEPQTPQNNSIAECTNHTGFWVFAVATATHVRNCAPSQVIKYISPHECLLNTPQDISYLHTFSCLAYTHTTMQQTKYDPTSQKLVFVGYETSTKGYKLWNPLSHSTVISTDLVFEESIFPLKTLK